MSVVASALVWAHSRATGSNLLVLLAIADAANQDCRDSYQSVATLGRMARVSESTVHRSLRALMEHGEIEVTGTHPQYGTNVYALTEALKGGVNLTPPVVEGGVTGAPEGVSPVAPEPTTNPTTTTGSLPTPSPQVNVRGPMSRSWRPSDETAATVREVAPGINHARELDAFRDWHISQDTSPKTHAQWDALFRGWCGRKQAQHEKDHPAEEVARDPVTGMPINPRPMTFAG